MIYRRREQRIKWTIYVRQAIVDMVEKYVEKTGYYKSDVIEIAVEKFLKEAENEKNSSN